MLAAGALALVGCGSSGEDARTTGEESARAATTAASDEQSACQLTTLRDTVRQVPIANTPTGISTRFGRSLIRVRVKRSFLRSTIAGHFGATKPFTPRSDAMFLTVTYSLENRGATPVVPSRTVNKAAILQGRSGMMWGTEQLDRCGPVAASLAKVEDVASPNSAIAPGRSATTVVAFVVPRAASRLAFTMQNAPLAVRLRPMK